MEKERTSIAWSDVMSRFQHFESMSAATGITVERLIWMQYTVDKIKELWESIKWMESHYVWS